MQTTTLSFTNLHNYGDLFANMLRARHETFIQQAKWDLPQADGMEYDQYDTPASRWIAVHEFGEVLAGIRLTPTTTKCGIYSYMIRDAQRGLLDSIPSDLLFEEAPVAPHVWESSRIFVSHRVPAKIRMRVQMNLINEMTLSARALGATSVIGLIPEKGPRWGRRVGLDIDVIGRVMDIGGANNACIRINLSNKLH
ncbi:N-acyl-L-homoserine lactone synthetase [Pacificibacter maritimus]|uniref:acyl-homoserine-lactone synthase n=1 Tax=Pacificibacter maritimus TaxID=762213 RepID=A0A3N4U870_9RHOB|nr:acyl-homoserine-lactone synthase [Pacificibacter maritimus]RPE63301.1 N-acyl-L-homoserine lactone synthetase [Pacificibacter maritimus]